MSRYHVGCFILRFLSFKMMIFDRLKNNFCGIIFISLLISFFFNSFRFHSMGPKLLRVVNIEFLH